MHYLRLTSPVNPESLADLPAAPGLAPQQPLLRCRAAYDQLAGGLNVFDPDLCCTNGFPTLGPPTRDIPEDLRNRILLYVLNSGNTVAPPCKQQSPFTFGGETTQYPHVASRPRPTRSRSPPRHRPRALIDSLGAGYHHQH